jgi:hypothetical protein
MESLWSHDHPFVQRVAIAGQLRDLSARIVDRTGIHLFSSHQPIASFNPRDRMIVACRARARTGRCPSRPDRFAQPCAAPSRRPVISSRQTIASSHLKIGSSQGQVTSTRRNRLLKRQARLIVSIGNALRLRQRSR